MSLRLPIALATVELALADALNLADASLVIFRQVALVEFKTEKLRPALSNTMEGGRSGWQIGPFDGHHCHLDLHAVNGVLFDAEPVSCQGGRLNYTIWFLAAAGCGNPFRPDGAFSVTLNAPYLVDGSPKLAVIAPVYSLYERYSQYEGVAASPGFVAAHPGLRTPA